MNICQDWRDGGTARGITLLLDTVSTFRILQKRRHGSGFALVDSSTGQDTTTGIV